MEKYLLTCRDTYRLGAREEESYFTDALQRLYWDGLIATTATTHPLWESGSGLCFIVIWGMKLGLEGGLALSVFNIRFWADLRINESRFDPPQSMWIPAVGKVTNCGTVLCWFLEAGEDVNPTAAVLTTFRSAEQDDSSSYIYFLLHLLEAL